MVWRSALSQLQLVYRKVLNLAKAVFVFFNDPRSFLYIFLRNKLKFELPSRHDKIVKIE